MKNESNDFFDPNDYSVNVPSGIHIGIPNVIYEVTPLIRLDGELLKNLENKKITLCNPMPIEGLKAVQIDEIADSEGVYYLGISQDTKVLKLSDITDYGNLLTQIAKWLQVCGITGVIVPLRGGFKPGLQLYVLTEGSLDTCWLPFTQGANGLNEEQIRHQLKSYLETKLINPVVTLAVVDTADSGDSALSLARILRDLRNECGGTNLLQVHFVLIFENHSGTKPFPPKTTQIKKLNNDKIVIRVFSCGLPSLLVEDWEKALGIRTIWKDDNTPEILMVPSHGKIIIQDYDGTLREYESDRLDQFMDHLIGREVSEAVITDPDLIFVQDVWQKHIRSENTDGDNWGEPGMGGASNAT